MCYICGWNMETNEFSIKIQTTIVLCTSISLDIINQFALGAANIIYLDIIERTAIGSFICAFNVFYLELEDGYNRNFHWKSNSNLLVHWCFSG